MNRKQARLRALRLAYEAVQKAVDGGGDEMGPDVESQIKIDKALNEIAQRMFERWRAAAERCAASATKETA